MHHPKDVPNYIIDAYEADADAPDWSDIVVDIQGDTTDDTTWLPLTAGQAEELRAALDHELRLRHGPSILDNLWASLDDLTARLMTGMRDGEPMDDDEQVATRYRAEGIAWSLAMMINPGQPNLDDIRETAMERYDSAHP